MLLHNIICVFLCILLKIKNISCEEGISLAFAIDDTTSMNNDIAQVKEGARDIVKSVLCKKSSNVKDFVLVTFNDDDFDAYNKEPGKKYPRAVVVRKITNSADEFLAHLNDVYPYNNGLNSDCPELALTGLQSALENSRPKSYIYVFTDASAKDFYKLAEIKRLCQSKQSQVVIVYTYKATKRCYEPKGPGFNVFYDIVKACSGQFIMVDPDKVKETLATTGILLQGKQSIFKWKIVQRSRKFVSVPFTLDEKAEYATVSAAGIYLDLKVTSTDKKNGPRPKYETETWIDNYKVLMLTDPKPGTYYAWVKGDSKVSVVVYGRTDFTIDYGFSGLQPKTMSDTTQQPIAGLKQHLSINVTDPDSTVDIKAVEILDIKNNDRIVNKLPLRKIRGNIYTTDAFVVPNDTFRIKVVGVIKITGKKIFRYSRTNINVQNIIPIPKTIPKVIIKEGLKLKVKYGTNETLTCEVTAHPKPKVKWHTSNGFLQKTNSYEKEDPLFISYLSLTNIKRDETYVCIASNEKGKGRSKKIKVSVRPVLKSISIPGANYNVKFGGVLKIPCNIKSYLPINIKWFKAGKELSHRSNEHYISPHGTKLTLKSMNISMQGIYTCEASLNSDPTVKQRYSIEVKIPGLARPKIISVKSVINDRNLKVICSISGLPAPVITWQFKSNGSMVFRKMPWSGEELNIPEVRMKDTGVYKCVAKNVLGEDQRNLDVIIEERPTIVNDNKNYNGVEGDLVLKIPCYVTGFPDPTVVWKIGSKILKNDSKYRINGTTLYINKPSQFDSKEYTCEAANKLGTATKTFSIEIIDPIPKTKPMVIIKEGLKLEVKYGSDETLKCEVTAHPKPNVKWHTSNGFLQNTNSYEKEDQIFISYLNLTNIKRDETYICIASNEIGIGKSKEIKVYVRPIFTNISIPGANYNAKFGEVLKIPCNIKSYLPINIKWFKADKELSYHSDEHYISPDGTELTLKSMNISMQGIYTCEASLNSDPTVKQPYNTEVKIPGLARATVVGMKSVINDRNLKVVCRINGVPPPVISWQFKFKGSEVFRKIPGSGEELNIPDARLKDTGVYKCVAKNVLGEDQRDLDLIVDERPTILNDESFYYGVEGDLVLKIPCNITGFPDPIVVWKIGSNILNNDSKYSIKGTTLYINKPAQSDSEEYTCEASNKLGKATKAFTVEVVEQFGDDDNFNGDTIDIFAVEGKPKYITCNIKNFESGSVRWYWDGVLTNQTGITFTIETASEDGNFTCRVNTAEGSKSETYIVNVGYSPTFDNPSSELIDWKNQNQMLNCKANAQPAAKYEWLHDGKTIETGYDLSQKAITGWGEYICRVSNIHGSNQKTFKVFTTGCFITNHLGTPNQPLASELDTPTWPNFISNSDILLKENDEIKLSCPSNKNTKNVNTFKIIPNKTEIIAKCLFQEKFTVAGKTYSYVDLQCNYKVEPSVQGTGEQCSGRNSEMIRVGFAVNGFLDVYKVCYDKNLNVPLYARAPTPVLRIGKEADPKEFEWSLTKELGYRKAENWKPEGSCKCCFTKGQLVNLNDAAFGPAQAAIFIENLNSIPIWNPLCDGSSRTSWQNFDSQTKEMSIWYNNWYSWTGASDYVRKDDGLVPRYLWKVMKYDGESSVMVFVNDKSPTMSDVRCSGPCDPLVEAEEFLYCCSLEEFSQKFNVPLQAFKDPGK